MRLALFFAKAASKSSFFVLDVIIYLVYIMLNMYTRHFHGKFQTKTSHGDASLVVHTIGPHPIIRHFLARMAFQKIVGDCLGSERHTLLSHEEALSILIQNIILSPAPLYRIAEWAAPVEPEALGITQRQKDALNDDRMARSLDMLASARSRNLFFLVALHVIKEFELDTRRIHHDTTTVTFYGEYAGSVMTPKITYGKNKDHRPDLKQLVFGLNITADGAVPISHEVYSGNKTDDVIHPDNMDQIRKILHKDDFIYVADSKLCTTKNLEHLATYQGQFVTVLPRTRKEDQNFRKKLRDNKEQVRWRHLASIPNPRRSGVIDTYWTTTDGPSESKEGHRLVWCKSSSKMENDSKKREASLDRSESDLQSYQQKNLSKKKKSEIRRAVKAILKKNGCLNLIAFDVHDVWETKHKRLKRGRPGKDDKLYEITEKKVSLTFKREKEAIAAEERTDGVFSLISNLPSPAYPKAEILNIYKYQAYVEKRHALYKSELGIAPVYLKKPMRAAGLLHATFLAMTVDALIERTVRRNMVKRNVSALPILPEGRMSKTPTTARILEAFSGVSWCEFNRGTEIISFPIKLTSLQRELLKLLEIDHSIYR